MKLKYITCAFFCGALMFSSCTSFFDVQTNTELNEKDYIGQESELYAGYIGIITKLQTVADRSIYVTDTRAEMLEPTSNAPHELYDLYNYKEDLTGNEYANPAPYYDVILACNDYLKRAKAFKDKNPDVVKADHYKALISCTLRVKAWTYLTLAKIYGKTYWYDSALESADDNSDVQEKDLKETVKACRSLLDNGYDGATGNISMSWKDWLDPNTAVGDSQYRYWDYMTPAYFALYAELCLWDGDYQKTVSLIQTEMNQTFATTVNDATHYMHNTKLTGTYSRIWDNSGKTPSPQEAVTAVLYDYTKNQTNQLLKHFGTESPNEYLLRPSEAGMARFNDDTFDPGSANDKRRDITFRTNSAGQYVVNKYRPIGSTTRQNAYEDDVPVYLYRATDLYFMMAEALNHLGRYEAASALINDGINGQFPNGGLAEADQSEWAGFTDDWTGASTLGNRKYPDLGIRGSWTGLGKRTFLTKATAGDKTDEEIQKANDEAILDEMLLEFSCEGRTLPAMVRIAQRWNDYTIISDRVVPKYPAATAGAIKTKIDNGDVFIHYDMNLK